MDKIVGRFSRPFCCSRRPGRWRSRVRPVKPAAADIRQMCAEVKPGDGRLKACVKEHFGQLAAPCQTALISNVTITRPARPTPSKNAPAFNPAAGVSRPA